MADGRRQDFPRLHGAWDDKLVAEVSDGSQHLLWQKAAAPANPSRCGAHVSCRTETPLPHLRPDVSSRGRQRAGGRRPPASSSASMK